VTTEGLLIYGLDDDLVFDPIALTEAVTPNSVWAALSKEEWTLALIISLILGEYGLVVEVMGRTPNDCIELVVKGVGKRHLGKLVGVLSGIIGKTVHVEFYLNWCLAILKFYGVVLENESKDYLQSFRQLYKNVKGGLEEVKKISDENSYNLEFLLDQCE
tara:strand:- start:65 stop:544 length:480 start_codon:yes stop_codon:yes gene_type:complete